MDTPYQAMKFAKEHVHEYPHTKTFDGERYKIYGYYHKMFVTTMKYDKERIKNMGYKFKVFNDGDIRVIYIKKK